MFIVERKPHVNKPRQRWHVTPTVFRLKRIGWFYKHIIPDGIGRIAFGKTGYGRRRVEVGQMRRELTVR